MNADQIPEIDFIHRSVWSWHVRFRRPDRFHDLRRVEHTSADPAPGCVKVLGEERRSGHTMVCEVRVPKAPGRGQQRAARIAREVLRQQEQIPLPGVES